MGHPPSARHFLKLDFVNVVRDGWWVTPSTRTGQSHSHTPRTWKFMEIQFSGMTLHILAFWTLMIHSGSSTRSGCEKPPWMAHERPRGYNSAMKGCERSTQRWTAASNIFQRIEEDLLQMNVVSYNTLISCYSQEGSAWLGLTWCNLGG